MGETDPTARFGRYRLLERLGAGGMAEIFKAVADGRGNRPVVIKRILRCHSDKQSFANMIATEARLSALLHHPNIVEVHDFGAVDGEYFLAMEYVDGVNLTALLKTAAAEQRQIPPGLVSLIISSVAAALAYAHALTDDQGRPLDIIHRDVSPANIMLSWLGEVKLVDFGIAEVANQVGDESADGDTLKGKFGYMSPEQAAAEHIDRRSDIFSLGIVFYEALVLARLFKGASDPETLRLVREAQVTPPSLLLKDLDPAIEAVVMKMLAPRPADRYASGGEVVAALAPIIRRRGSDAQALRQFLHVIHPPRPAVPPVEDEPVTVSVPEAPPPMPPRDR